MKIMKRLAAYGMFIIKCSLETLGNLENQWPIAWSLYSHASRIWSPISLNHQQCCQSCIVRFQKRLFSRIVVLLVALPFLGLFLLRWSYAPKLWSTWGLPEPYHGSLLVPKSSIKNPTVARFFPNSHSLKFHLVISEGWVPKFSPPRK